MTTTSTRPLPSYRKRYIDDSEVEAIYGIRRRALLIEPDRLDQLATSYSLLLDQVIGE